MTEQAFGQVLPAITDLSDLIMEDIQAAASYTNLFQDLNIDLIGIEPLLAEAIFSIHLLGRAQVWTEISDSNPRFPARLIFGEDETEFVPLPFEEAIQFFRNKVVLSPIEFAVLTDAAKAKAFSIARGATEQIRLSIFDLINQAQSDGLTLPQFQRLAAEVLQTAGVAAEAPWYWETVYRTNLQSSYQAGRWQQSSHPDVVASRPWLRYISARLPTSRVSHVEKHARIYRQDDPFWNEWAPPNGFNCFCTIHTIGQRDLDRNGWTITESSVLSLPADKGFQTNIGKTESI